MKPHARATAAGHPDGLDMDLLAELVTDEGGVDVDDEMPGGWEPITCQEREELVHRSDPRLTVLASRTDLDGEFGAPEIFTEWGTPEGEPVLREHRYPDHANPDGSSRPDVQPCEHFRWMAQP